MTYSRADIERQIAAIRAALTKNPTLHLPVYQGSPLDYLAVHELLRAGEVYIVARSFQQVTLAKREEALV